MDKNNRWVINRIGLIDFWYYDDEEFYFDNGRLLLRGSNGSGKSVTMQSFIPLLLDGNKTPSRLDPFGSRARKMENYLISEEDGIDDRTGYLYMEFKKNKSYMTIGMGLRAVKNKSIDSWYFSINDGRRVGFDFSLYKKMDGKFVLSKKELLNRIGEGGEVVTKQESYMNIVNKLLFGYERLEDYDELIKLLVQLRSPKLSKEFKPTVVYEIMTNSLQTLTDEDLRPMSEAIENMDSIKINLDVLKESRKAGDKISRVYDDYNKYVLTEKADYYIKAQKEQEGLTKQKLNLIKDKDLLTEQCDVAREKLIQLKEEQIALENKKSSLSSMEVIEINVKLNEAEKELREIESELEKKKIALGGEKQKEVKYRADKKDAQVEEEEIKSKLVGYLDDMNDLAERIKFDEQNFFYNEIIDKVEEEYDFDYVSTQIDEYFDSIKKGLDAIKIKEEIDKRYDLKLKERDNIKQETEGLSNELVQLENLFGQIKEEFKEQMYKWEDENNYLKISREKMVEISQLINRYRDNASYDDILSIVREHFNLKYEELNEEKSKIVHKKNILNKEISEIDEKIQEIESNKDPEPDRNENVLKNRIRLQKEGIPFVPFYKAVDFNEDTNEKLKGIIEEALTEMGILDALIISPEYRKKALKMDEGLADKYIFADPKFLCYELTQQLKVDKFNVDGITGEMVEDALRSILVSDSAGEAHLGEDGTYTAGIIRGIVSRTYIPRFIGTAARERHKKELLEKLNNSKIELEAKLNNTVELIKEMDIRINLLKAEFSNFPSNTDLEVSYKDYYSKKFEYESRQKELKRVEEEAEKEYENLIASKEKVRILTETIKLPKTRKDYMDAIVVIEEYKNNLLNVKLEHGKLMQKIVNIKILEDRIQDIEDRMDELYYDINRFEFNERKLKSEKKSYEERLKLSDYDAIQKELNYCMNRLDEIPKEIQEEIKTETQASTEYKNKDLLSHELDKQIDIHVQVVQTYEKAFIEEYKLHYVYTKQLSDNYYQDAQVVYTENKALFTNGRTKEEYAKRVYDTYYVNVGYLREYQLNIENMLSVIQHGEIDEVKLAREKLGRLILKGKINGKTVSFIELMEELKEQIIKHENLLKESDREIFEDILINNVAKKIRAKIYHSIQWVNKMNDLMEAMNTSSGLLFSLRWKKKKAETEGELDTKDLVSLLERDAHLLQEEQLDRLTIHFRTKIRQARNRMDENGNSQTFHSIMKEILDYRQWFEFQLFYTRRGEKRKELTNNAFFTFSGGEKAMAMYVPLFSAVYARYEGARKDCPRLISLDEAFAGVDENNIRDMFKLMIELEFDFIINSQILWGDYDTVPSLGISELLRENNAKFVSVMRYRWNGKYKEILTGDRYGA